MTISRAVRVLTRRGRECLELYRSARLAKRRSLFLARILTPTQDSQQEWLSRSLGNLSQEISLLHSEQSLLNTPETSGILVHLTVISPAGQRKVSYSGTPFLVAELVSRFLTTGLTDAGTSLPKKSSKRRTKRVSSSPSSALLPDVTLTPSNPPRPSQSGTLPPEE